MSMKPTFYVMAGTAIPTEQFPGNPWDDKWLPYFEGHEGVEMAILRGEGDNHIYCGRILGWADHHSEAGYQMLTPRFDGVVSWLAGELNWHGDIGVMLVVVWR